MLLLTVGGWVVCCWVLLMAISILHYPFLIILPFLLILNRFGVEKGKEVSSIMEGWDFLQLISALVINSEMPSIQTKVFPSSLPFLLFSSLLTHSPFPFSPSRPNLLIAKQVVVSVKDLRENKVRGKKGEAIEKRRWKRERE